MPGYDNGRLCRLSGSKRLYKQKKYLPHVNAHKINDSTFLISNSSIIKAATTTATSDKTATDENGKYIPDGTEAIVGLTTVTKEMLQADMNAIQSENEGALKTNGSNAIVGEDAGTDGLGNTYRCIHYDNWNTILYWNDRDPHVYDKCIKNHCSKRILIHPMEEAGAKVNPICFTFPSRDGDRGDGKSFIGYSIFGYNPQVMTYKNSVIRAKLIGSSQDTYLDEEEIDDTASSMAWYYRDGTFGSLSSDHQKINGFFSSLSEEKKSYIAAFPKNIRDHMGARKIEEDIYGRDKEDPFYDKLWLFSLMDCAQNNIDCGRPVGGRSPSSAEALARDVLSRYGQYFLISRLTMDKKISSVSPQLPYMISPGFVLKRNTQ